MKGLIKKDIYTIKGNLRIVLIIFAVFIVMTLNGKSDMSFILPLICVMLFVSTFSYDEYNKFDAYAIAFPSGREKIVKSKYFATTIVVIIGVLVTTLVSIIIGLVNNNLDIETIISTSFGSLFAVSLIQAIMYPLIIKFGIEKGRIGLFVGAMIITIVGGFLLKDINPDSYKGILDFLNNYFIIIIPVVIIAMLYISYRISRKIYLKKEF